MERMYMAMAGVYSVNCAQRLRCVALAMVCALILSVNSLAVAAELTTAQRAEIFGKIWSTTQRWYPSFREKGVDWEQVKTDYAPGVASAATDEVFYELMDAMLRELHDGHTQVLSHPSQGRSVGMPAIRLIEAEGDRVAVAEVTPGSQAEKLGVRPGMVLTAVDSLPVEARIAKLTPNITASTPWYARTIAVTNLLAGKYGKELALTFDSGETIRLQCTDNSPGRYEFEISSRMLDGNIGYIRIPNWSNDAHIVQNFDRELLKVQNARALIIDARGNPGGNDGLTGMVIARLIQQPVNVTRVRQRFGMFGRLYDSPTVTRSLLPRRGLTYTNPVIVLSDSQVFSSGEFFMAAMKDSGRAKIVGMTTAGSSGNPMEFTAGQVKYRVSTWRQYRLNGAPIEGRGIEPDIPVTVTLNDLRYARDSWMDAALTYLNTQK